MVEQGGEDALALGEGVGADGDVVHEAPYLTEHVRRFGEYSARELGIQPEGYAPHLDVAFSPLRGDGPGADGHGQEA
ncbi:hypothetical protein AMK16_26480 [Streptomyces sp. CB00455]|uniref:hypothetical protein n=1 Tax=Streptomyces sp. CB00455 TaxID=1703927 RepID=UPI00093E6F3D|nr:hypothetical protein [Streptomyces sp. CB00455]OKK16230.1 hypothetical protein AMK16_26480 [Streptomyces sp. CB00455]